MAFFHGPLKNLEQALETIRGALPTLPEGQLRHELETLRTSCGTRPMASLLLDLYEGEIENRRKPRELAL